MSSHRRCHQFSMTLRGPDTGRTMMMNGFDTGMGFGGGLGMLLILVLVVLAIVALIKYLRS